MQLWRNAEEIDNNLAIMIEKKTKSWLFDKGFLWNILKMERGEMHFF